jgi:non-heme chloroperoxidase
MRADDVAYLKTPDGVSLYYEDEGHGQAIILVHGGSASSAFWTKQVSALRESFRVVAIDNRAHGRSEKTPDGHTIAQYARDLRHVMDELDIPRAVLVGWSMGFAVVLSYVEQFGEGRLDGVVDVDQKPRMWTSEEGLQAMLHAIRTRRLEFHEQRLRSFFATSQPSELIRYFALELMKTPAAAYCSSLEDVWRTDFTPVLFRLTVPLLVTTGARGILGPEGAERVCELAPNGRTSVFSQSGHMLFWEEPHHFNAELTAFVNSTACAVRERESA